MLLRTRLRTMVNSFCPALHSLGQYSETVFKLRGGWLLRLV